MWHARLTMPALLARFDEERVVSTVAAINGGVAILGIALFAWLTDLPLIFPALGPTVFILFSAPMTPAAAPRSVVLGHFTGMLSGFVVWHLISLFAGAPVSLENGGWPLVLSASMALAACCFWLIRLSCPHAPACATAMIVALGGVTHWSELLLMGIAVVWVTTQAVVINRLVGMPVTSWSPHDRHAP